MGRPLFRGGRPRHSGAGDKVLDTVQHHDTTAERTEPMGWVLSVEGARASLRLNVRPRAGAAGEPQATVGRFIGIGTATSLLVGVITKLAVPTPHGGKDSDCAIAQMDLVGEIKWDAAGAAHFQRGVTEYPIIGDPAALLGHDELRLIYDVSNANTIEIGHLQQDASIGAYINVDDMVAKHFAVLGTTGVGKSSGVALIMRQILEARPDLRFFLIDPHNEYARCFGERAQVLNPRNLKLPFWLFSFEEIVDVFYRGRPGVEEEVAILSEIIPLAKASLLATAPPTG